jgi:hypothetical protein
MQLKLVGIIGVDSNAIGQLLIIYSVFVKYIRKNQLFIGFKKTYDSVRKMALYNILNVFGISMKLVRLIKMCLNETYSRNRVGQHMSGMFPIKNGLKHGDAL